jgi:hypothetical protein
LIRRLAEFSRDKALTIRAAPLVEAAPDPPSRALVDALVRSRLVTLIGESASTSLRLAHQRVLTDWARAAEIVAESGPFHRIREEVEAQRQRWETGNRRGELLLACHSRRATWRRATWRRARGGAAPWNTLVHRRVATAGEPDAGARLERGGGVCDRGAPRGRVRRVRTIRTKACRRYRSGR